MEVTWSLIGVLTAVAFFTAAALGWFVRKESVAYPLALGFGAILIFAPMVFEMSRHFDGG